VALDADDVPDRFGYGEPLGVRVWKDARRELEQPRWSFTSTFLGEDADNPPHAGLSSEPGVVAALL
jgi:hypothetical protein